MPQKDAPQSQMNAIHTVIKSDQWRGAQKLQNVPVLVLIIYQKLLH